MWVGGVADCQRRCTPRRGRPRPAGGPPRAGLEVVLPGSARKTTSRRCVQNKSEIPGKFSWKQFVNTDEEQAERA